MILLISILTLALLVFIVLRDVIAPPFVLCLAWAFPVFIGLLDKGFNSGIFNDPFYAFYVIGLVLFITGYFIAQRSIPTNLTHFQIYKTKHFLPTFVIVGLLVVEILVAVVALWKIKSYVIQNFSYNFWLTFKLGTSTHELDLGFAYRVLQQFSKVFTLYMFIEALYRKNRTQWVLTSCQLLLAIVLVLFSGGRSFMFALLIPLMFSYMIFHRNNIWHILKIGSISLIILLLIFMLIHRLKYAYLDTGGLISSLSSYATFPLLAFKEYVYGYREYFNGAYFFRFIFAVLNSIGFDTSVVPLEETFRFTDFAYYGNVYTFYKWYSNDFGIIFALFIQFMCGALHGTLYKNMYVKCTAGLVFWNSLLYYPLLMQFFQDQYVSLTSNWVQIFIFYVIFYRVLVKRRVH